MCASWFTPLFLLERLFHRLTVMAHSPTPSRRNPPMIAEPTLLEDVEALYACRREAIDNPYPIYHRMRAESPVLVHKGVAAVTRYADVEAILRNMTDYSNRRGAGSRI